MGISGHVHVLATHRWSAKTRPSARLRQDLGCFSQGGSCSPRVISFPRLRGHVTLASRMPKHSLDDLLACLEAAKGRFGPGESAETERLLSRLSRHPFRDPRSLLRFHEVLLFLRAFPQGPSVVSLAENLLNGFHERIAWLRSSGADMSVFDDFDTSGIAGTTMQDTLTFEVVRWLARRIPRNDEIAWDDYEEERAIGSTWPRFIPLLEEDADVEANIPWHRWLDAARGRERQLDWLVRQFERLDVSDRERAELFDSLRLPIRWNLGNLRFSRTRNWSRPHRFYDHAEPLITRSQVSLSRELAQPGPRLTKLSRRAGEAVMHTIREVMAVRYRELYGTTLGDPNSVTRADLGRGVVMHFWNLPPHRRLPLRAYVAGFTLKNGVPINYIEAIGLCDWIEIGFNTFYTFRQGETAWIYAQVLRCLRQLTGATTFSVYPYQIGQNNDEAIDSGAFWFYRKLGFRSGRPDLEQLARREEQKIAADPRYRTPARILKRLAEAHVFYELDRSGPGPWDTFSTRNLGLRINRRMAQEFDGDSRRIRRESVKEVTHALKASLARWTPAEQRAFENWALVLALIPNLRRWSAKEKEELLRIIRAQAGDNEMRYLKLTQRHLCLRGELLHLGLKP